MSLQYKTTYEYTIPNMGNTLDFFDFFTLYGRDCREEEEKKGKTWRNEVDTKQ